MNTLDKCFYKRSKESSKQCKAKLPISVFHKNKHIHNSNNLSYNTLGSSISPNSNLHSTINFSRTVSRTLTSMTKPYLAALLATLTMTSLPLTTRPRTPRALPKFSQGMFLLTPVSRKTSTTSSAQPTCSTPSK